MSQCRLVGELSIDNASQGQRLSSSAESGNNRPSTIELPVWIDTDDALYSVMMEDDADSDDDDDGIIRNSDISDSPSNNEDPRRKMHTIAKQFKSTIAAVKTAGGSTIDSAGHKKTKSMLKWQSGRKNWYSVLELAHVHDRILRVESKSWTQGLVYVDK